MKLKSILFIIFIASSISTAQSVNIGFRLESLSYSYKNIKTNGSQEYMMPLPISGYIKSSIMYRKYELEIKVGEQLGDRFAGSEYAASFKYNFIGNIYALVTYLEHFNLADSRTNAGTLGTRIDFAGLGLEAKLTKVFGVDLVYYKSVGKKGLEYTNHFSGISNLYRTTDTEMGPMIKLGFIFNISLYKNS